MHRERREPERYRERSFESEPADEWHEWIGRGGPIRSDEPERDYFFESNAAPARPRSEREEQMNWRAEGAQDYPGGRLDEELARANHRGKGPRDYRPRDERIREIVCERLTDDPFIDASDISVSVAGAEVSLSGTVESRRMKYGAEEIAAGVPGVAHVNNSIRVERANG